MPRSTDGTWVEFTAPSTPNDPNTAAIVRVFSAETPALRSAVKSGNDVIRIRYGETLAEALKREAAERQPKQPASTKVEEGRS